MPMKVEERIRVKRGGERRNGRRVKSEEREREEMEEVTTESWLEGGKRQTVRERQQLKKQHMNEN